MEEPTKLCRACNTTKPLSGFYARTGGVLGRRPECKTCCSANDKARYHGKYRHDPAFRERMRVVGREHYAAKREFYKERHRSNDRITREEVLRHYGGRCACCGEEQYEFLALDHIDGGGSQHRRSAGYSSLHRWLKRSGFPGGYRVLCHNCNAATGFYGYCPHQKRPPE